MFWNARRFAALAGVAALLALMATAPVRAAEYHNGGFSFSTGPVPAFVQERPPAPAWPQDAPGADDEEWRYWRYDRQVDRRRGQDVAYADYIFEPRSQGKLADAGKFDIEFNPEYQKLILHRIELRRGGEWHNRLHPESISIARREQQFEQDISDGTVAALIVIDDVRVGDVVRISYSIVGSNPILAGQSSELVRLAYGHPILDVRMRVLYPPATRVAVHRENAAPAPSIRQIAEATEVVVEASRVDRLLNEGNYPAWYQPYPLVQVAPERSWNDVARWAVPLYPDRGAAALPTDLEQRLAQWRQLATPAERFRAALRAVQDEIRYFGVETGTSSHRPREPELVWKRRYGDCKDKAWLLVTLLQRLGIRAEPALVDTRRGRGAKNYVPAADLFNHVIVRAHLDGREVFVDPTIRLQGGAPRDRDLSDYGYVLPVLATQQDMVEVPAPPKTDNAVEVHEDFAADGDVLRLSVRTVYRGAFADNQRRELDGKRLEDFARGYREYYSKEYGALEQLAPLAVNDDRDANVITIREAYRLTSPWRVDGRDSALFVDAKSASGATSLPSRTDRKGPLQFTLRGRYLDEVTLTTPEGWVPRFAREDDTVSSGAFTYRRLLESEAGKTRLTAEVTVAKREIAPADVPAHVEAMRGIRNGLRSRLQFRVPSSGDAAEREARLKNLLRNAMEER